MLITQTNLLYSSLLNSSDLRTHVKPVSWEQFASKLQDIGFGIQLSPPAPGTIITFNDRYEQVIVKTNAITPDEYVDAIAEYLGIQYSTGKEG